MVVKPPEKPFHTFHGNHLAPKPDTLAWLENDHEAYLQSPNGPDLPGLEDYETVRWLVNLDGLADPEEPKSRPSSSSSSASLSPATPDTSPMRPAGRRLRPFPPYRSTIPKASQPRTRPTLPASFFSDTSIRPGTPQSEKKFHDRFIPARDSPVSTPRSEMYRLTKTPCELTPSEKLLRHRGDTPDPFAASPKPQQGGENQTNDESRPNSPISTSSPTVLSPIHTDSNTNAGDTERQISYGSTWSVGGVAPAGSSAGNGRGGMVQSGTNVPLYTTTYPTWRANSSEDNQKHRERLASALDIDRANRVLGLYNKPIGSHGYSASPMPRRSSLKKTHWTGHKWEKTCSTQGKTRKVSETRILPSSPFKVLDAPRLRDDFYCSVLAFNPICNTLAVGLGNMVYGWSEKKGVSCLNAGLPGEEETTWVTSLAFSSAEGGKSILAVGRSSGKVALLSLFDSMIPRFELVYAHAVTSLAWRPRMSVRTSRSPCNMPGLGVKTEDLLVGDEKGRLWYYSVEWPDSREVTRNGWAGRPSLLARIQAHGQQICGLSWSPDGNLFASGGNDDLCSLFELKTVLGEDDEAIQHEIAVEADRSRGDSHNTKLLRKLFGSSKPAWLGQKVSTNKNLGLVAHGVTLRDKGKKRATSDSTKDMPAATAKHRWRHGAAVKAIAFCPWRSGLLATGGGSHDKAIHFYHTTTGAALATIAVSAQVTSLIWSKTKREIAACFGYAQPEHPVRIAVFSWPECKQVAAIPWEGEMRALCAVGWPLSARKSRAEMSARKMCRGKQVKKSRSWETSQESEKENMREHAGRSRMQRRSESEIWRVGRDGPGRSTAEGIRNSSQAIWEGCIVVAASDESVKFHEVWEADNEIAAGGPGMLGGSDILEGLEGIDKEGEVIR